MQTLTKLSVIILGICCLAWNYVTVFPTLGTVGGTVAVTGETDLTFVDGATATGTGTAISVTHGLTIAEGDLVLAFVDVNAVATIADNNGASAFAEAAEGTAAPGDPVGGRRAIYWRIAGASEPAAYAFTASYSTPWRVVVTQWTPDAGYNVQSPPFDVYPETNMDTGSSTAPDTGAITILNDASIAISIATEDGPSGTFTATPAGYTVAYKIDGANARPTAIYYKAVDAGSENPGAYTLDPTGDWGCEVFSLLPATGSDPSPPGGGIGYYVTQTGAGDTEPNGSVTNPYSVAEFNALSGDYSYKIFFFSGTITTQIVPQVYGTTGSPVILDGLSSGDYDALGEGSDGQAIINIGNQLSGYGVATYTPSYGPGNGKDYIIIQDFEIKEAAHGIFIASGSDHIVVRRNFIHDCGYGGVTVTQDSVSYIHASYITVGGSATDGNSIKDIGFDTAGSDVRFAEAQHFVCSYNHLYASKSNGDSGDRGIDGISPLNRASYGLIEYNTIENHLDRYGDRGEDGTDTKDDNNEGGTHDLVFRGNLIRNHYGQSNTTTQTQSYNIYYIGNNVSMSNWGSFYIKEGKCGGDPSVCDTTVHDVYMLSNLSWREADAGSRVHGDTGGVSTLPYNLFYYNNTFSENARPTTIANWPLFDDEHGSTFTHLTLYTSGASVKNNVFINPRPTYGDYNSRQIWTDNAITLDDNHYYYSGGTSTVSINGTVANATTTDTNGEDSDPGLTDISNGDFTVAAVGSNVVDKATDLAGEITSLTIYDGFGEAHVVSIDPKVGLDPTTDWTSSPVSVVWADRSVDGWDRGAYVYVAP